MEIGGVFSTMFETLRTRMLGLIGIWLAFFVLQIVAMFGFASAIGFGAMAAGAMSGVESGTGLLGLGAGMFGMFLLFYLVYFAIYFAQILAMAHYASPLVSQDIGASFGVGFRGILTMFGVLILFIVTYFAVGIVFAIVVAILAAALGEVATVILLFLMVPAIIYLMCRLVMLPPVVAVDGVKNPVTALTRTWKLSRGHVLTIFLSLLGFGILAVLVFGAMLAGFYGTITGMEETMMMGDGPPVGTIVTMVLMFSIVSLIFAAAGAALFSAMHSKVSDLGTENLTETFG